jgi:hypothetical protein
VPRIQAIADAFNHQIVEQALQSPPRCVLDGFGQRRGPVWERWQRDLAGLLEWMAVCRGILRGPETTWLAEAAADGRPSIDWERCWSYERWRRRCAKTGRCALDT